MQAVLRDRKPSDILLGILLATDFLFIVGHILFLSTSYVHDNNYSILEERGLAEAFQYIKAYWLLLMFVMLAITRERAYLAWAAVFTYLGADDLLEIHEEGGNTVAIRYDFPEWLGLRARDLGELAIFSVAGIVLLTILVIAYQRGSDTFKQHSRSLILFSALLVIAGVVVDAVHIPLLETIADHPLAILEDGGEMVVLSIICWYVFRLLSSTKTVDSDTAELPVLGVRQQIARQPQHANND